MEEDNSHSDDPVAEAIKILEDTTNPGKAENGKENSTLPDKDDRNREAQSAVETENRESDRSEHKSSEQSFWFRLADSDMDETK